MDNIGSYEVVVVTLVIFGILLIPAIFYLITLQKALTVVSPQNRKMPPGQVWLMFIPLFNIVWYFIIVDAVAVSFEREYAARGVGSEPKPTYSIGLATAILNVCGIIPIIGVLAGLATLVCWIMHWVKVNEHKNNLERMNYDDPRPTIFDQ